MRKGSMNVREIVLIALLAVLITVSSTIKIPSPFAGAEFQMSAPIAVVICAYFGFKKYFIAGVVSSAVGFMLGTQTILNIVIALTFRLVVGIVLFIAGPGFIPISLSGLLGSIAARGVITLLIGKGFTAMVIVAIPGLVFTMIVSWPLYKIVKKTMSRTSFNKENILEINLKEKILNEKN